MKRNKKPVTDPLLTPASPLAENPFGNTALCDQLNELKGKITVKVPPGSGDEKPNAVRPDPKRLRKALETTKPAPVKERSISNTPPAFQNKEKEEDLTLWQNEIASITPFKKSAANRVDFAHFEKEFSFSSEDQEVMDHLQNLVDGTLPFDIEFSDEYVEGFVRGFDKNVLKRLKNGEFSVQATLDLHRLNRDIAKREVIQFISQAKYNARCVLIIHGRGLNSEFNIPVLKENLVKWLTRGSIAKTILAFVTARPYDGGPGAIYVLLRKPSS